MYIQVIKMFYYVTIQSLQMGITRLSAWHEVKRNILENPVTPLQFSVN